MLAGLLGKIQRRVATLRRRAGLTSRTRVTTKTGQASVAADQVNGGSAAVMAGAVMAGAVTTDAVTTDYDVRIAQEIANYKEVANVHDLPDIFHYWSNKYLAPMMAELGITGIDDFFASNLLQAAHDCGHDPARFVSIGAGNCDTEIRIAKLLVQRGLRQFKFECLELNPHMLDRGRRDALSEGVAEHMVFIKADFNTWQPSATYAGVMANHSLHHVVNLEGLFDGVKQSLDPRGRFVVSDIIGRNGHQRWPEALSRVNEFWQQLPRAYRYNRLLQRQEDTYINWDCSTEGFEGIRAQDIMPLLVERFNFQMFFGFANIVSIFVDRAFGHNFNATADWDRQFIDRIHQADEQAFKSGELKPAQMLAVMCSGPIETRQFLRGLTPEGSIRWPEGVSA